MVHRQNDGGDVHNGEGDRKTLGRPPDLDFVKAQAMTELAASFITEGAGFERHDAPVVSAVPVEQIRPVCIILLGQHTLLFHGNQRKEAVPFQFASVIGIHNAL